MYRSEMCTLLGTYLYLKVKVKMKVKCLRSYWELLVIVSSHKTRMKVEMEVKCLGSY